MAGERMTVARLAKNLNELSERVDALSAQMDQRFEQVDRRFEQVDRRFDTLRADILADNNASLEKFADRIERRVQILLEGMKGEFKAALDRTTANTERLDTFERVNAEEHRLMQAQIDDLDAKRQSRPRRRPS